MSETQSNTPNYTPIRICHIIKRDNFDGYGFNLHAEKGKQGQYIGKVDKDSPAEEAGLCEGDRIITVNDVNIGTENHKQVVQRIKAITNEVRLLVVDKTITVSKTNEIVEPTSPTPAIDANDKNQNNSIPETDNDTQISTNNNIIPSISNKNPSDDRNLMNSETNSKSADSNNMNGHNKLTPSDDSNLQGTSNKSSSLHLPLTAAEMRAQLAKKKQNTKNELLDLRQKYEIAQRL